MASQRWTKRINTLSLSSPWMKRNTKLSVNAQRSFAIALNISPFPTFLGFTIPLTLLNYYRHTVHIRSYWVEYGLHQVCTEQICTLKPVLTDKAISTLNSGNKGWRHSKSEQCDTIWRTSVELSTHMALLLPGLEEQALVLYSETGKYTQSSFPRLLLLGIIFSKLAKAITVLYTGAKHQGHIHSVLG